MIRKPRRDGIVKGRHIEGLPSEIQKTLVKTLCGNVGQNYSMQFNIVIHLLFYNYNVNIDVGAKASIQN